MSNCHSLHEVIEGEDRTYQVRCQKPAGHSGGHYFWQGGIIHRWEDNGPDKTLPLEEPPIMAEEEEKAWDGESLDPDAMVRPLTKALRSVVDPTPFPGNPHVVEGARIDLEVSTKEEFLVDPQEFVRAFLRHIGEDPERDGLRDTPERVVRSWGELFAGYGVDPRSVVTVFSEPCDQMVVLRDIEFYSTCEHHLLPFYGVAHIGYLPQGRVIGISKLARLLEVFARRLQIQERIAQQTCDALWSILQPIGCGVILEARHFCMVCRGVGKQNSTMVTSAVQGAFRANGDARFEFFRMCGK